MSNELKKTIIYIMPLYLSKECPAFDELIKAIEDIPDEKFAQVINQQLLPTKQRIDYVLDEIIFFINQHYPINHEQGLQLDRFINEIKHIFMALLHDNETMKSRISLLENNNHVLNNDRNQTKKLRTVAEILTPILKEIRNMMINRHIPDCYYGKTIIHACLLRSKGQNISWEVADFNRDNPQTTFDVNILNKVESVIQYQASLLRIDYQTLLELLSIKSDRNEIEHDSIKNFLRYNSHVNKSFNAYLSSIGITDIFDMNQKLCLETLYRSYFLDHYYSI